MLLHPLGVHLKKLPPILLSVQSELNFCKVSAIVLSFSFEISTATISLYFMLNGAMEMGATFPMDDSLTWCDDAGGTE